ncbi:MAG: hypothetical protein GC168_10030 [Candidatus Hydrogenedens sp.]|nr:hypothetical protein [Candidatus Hydrogenedens sp.]
MATQSNGNNPFLIVATVLLTAVVVAYITRNAPPDLFAELAALFPPANDSPPSNQAVSQKPITQSAVPKRAPAIKAQQESHPQPVFQQQDWPEDYYDQDYAKQEATHRDFEVQQGEWEAQQQELEAQIQEAARQSLERDLVELSRKAILRQISVSRIHGAPGRPMDYAITGYQWRSNDASNPTVFWVEIYGAYRANLAINYGLEIHLNGRNLEVVYCELMK